MASQHGAVALVVERARAASLSRSTPSIELREVVRADRDAGRRPARTYSSSQVDHRRHLGHHPELAVRARPPSGLASISARQALHLPSRAHEGDHQVQVGQLAPHLGDARAAPARRGPARACSGSSRDSRSSGSLRPARAPRRRRARGTRSSGSPSRDRSPAAARRRRRRCAARVGHATHEARRPRLRVSSSRGCAPSSADEHHELGAQQPDAIHVAARRSPPRDRARRG